jgi:hypothetical protein
MPLSSDASTGKQRSRNVLMIGVRALICYGPATSLAPVAYVSKPSHVCLFSYVILKSHGWTYNGIAGVVGVEQVPGLTHLGIVASRASGVVQRRSSIMRSTRSAWDDMRRRDRSAHAQRRLVSATQCRVTSAPQR